MPTGIVPASSDLLVKIQTDPLDTFTLADGRAGESSVVVSIPKFNNRSAFSLPLREISPDAPQSIRLRRLKIDCLSGCSNIAITSTGFWSDTAGIVSEANASEFDIVNAPSPLSINLARADLFRGVIELPDGIFASGDEKFTVNLVGSQFLNPATFSQAIEPGAGDSRVGFSVGVPPSETGGGWSLNLSCDGCQSNLLTGPFYATTETGAPLSVSQEDQFIFLKGRNYTNVTLPLLKNQEATTVPAIVPLLLDD